MQLIRRFAGYLHKYRLWAALAVFCVAAETVFELVIPMIMVNIVDVGVANGDRAYIFQQGALMCVCAVIAMVLGVGSARFSALCGHGLAAEVRKAEYTKIQSFSFANRDRFQTESLVTRLTSDVTTIQNAVINGLRPGVRSPIMMITALCMSFLINARLALVFLVAAPALGFLLFQIIRHVRPLYSRMQRAIDLVNRIVQENLTAVRIVKAYVRGDYEIEKFGQVNDNLCQVSRQAMRIAVLNMPAMQLVMYGTILAILWIGGGMIIGGTMQIGKLTGFLSYVLQVLNSLMMFSNVFLLLTRAIASGQRIFEVIDEPLDITEEDAQDVTVEHGDIEFDHVSFQYRAGAAEYVLRDITLTIPAGSTVGIIGGTGSAKSTLVQLIPRLYDVTSGSVKVAGIDVRDYDIETLRNEVSMVLQKNVLFSGTIKENLRWGDKNASDEELARVCKLACADEFIERFPDKYDTWIEQGGSNVSGGQKQRLCIARALLKKPKILILDDSTSAVDTHTDAMIRKAFREEIPDTTKIIIAQRVSSVQDSDKIVVLNDGQIDGIGTHEELLKTNAIYREVYESQQKHSEEGGEAE